MVGVVKGEHSRYSSTRPWTHSHADFVVSFPPSKVLPRAFTHSQHGSLLSEVLLALKKVLHTNTLS